MRLPKLYKMVRLGSLGKIVRAILNGHVFQLRLPMPNRMVTLVLLIILPVGLFIL